MQKGNRTFQVAYIQAVREKEFSFVCTSVFNTFLHSNRKERERYIFKTLRKSSSCTNVLSSAENPWQFSNCQGTPSKLTFCIHMLTTRWYVIRVCLQRSIEIRFVRLQRENSEPSVYLILSLWQACHYFEPQTPRYHGGRRQVLPLHCNYICDMCAFCLGVKIQD